MKRAGFTLIELLVVIVVIAILAALLFPAITGAVQTAREATVVTDIANFQSDFVAFKNRFGILPPSFVVLVEDSSLWGTDWNSSPPIAGLSDLHRRSSRGLIRQLWPEFDFAHAPIDINDDGDATDVLVLNGAESMAFFVGGMPDWVDTNGDGNVDESDLVVSGFASPADGRNVTLEVGETGRFVNCSGGSPGCTQIAPNCADLGTCTCTGPDCPCTNPAGCSNGSGLKSREWRQLFMR